MEINDELQDNWNLLLLPIKASTGLKSLASL